MSLTYIRTFRLLANRLPVLATLHARVRQTRPNREASAVAEIRTVQLLQYSSISLKLIVIGLAATPLVLTGLGSSVIFGGQPGNDFAVFYNAGHLLLDQANPYLPHAPTQAVPLELKDRLGPYCYPPQFSSIIIAFALLPYNVARSFFDALNLGAIALLAWTTTLFLWPGRRLATVSLARGPQAAASFADWRRHWWIVVAIMLSQPMTSYTLWLGQTTICIFAALFLAWWFEMRGDWLRAGGLLGIATCNPPLVVLPIVWLLCDRRLKTLIVGLLTALAMSFPAVYVLGPLNAFHAWYKGLLSCNVFGANIPGHPEVFGIQSFFAAAGLPVGDLTLIGIACAIVMWFFRSRLTETETLALLVVAGLLTVFAHTYTLVGLIIAVPILCKHMDRRHWVVPVALSLGCLILMPRRLVHVLGLPDLLLHWRVPLVLGLALMMIVLVVLREREKCGGRLSRD
jgi:hypothetical protein